MKDILIIEAEFLSQDNINVINTKDLLLNSYETLLKLCIIT